MGSIIKADDEQQFLTVLSKYIEEKASEAIRDRGKFFVGFSGASLVKLLAGALPLVKSEWSRWMVAFCDERLVPADSADLTYGAYVRDVLPHVPLVRDQFITVKQNVNAHEAAADYAAKLRAAFDTERDDFSFDLLLLGMGPDGHTCSLFPGHPLLEEKVLSVAAIEDSPKPPPCRITLTLSAINRARSCAYVLCGVAKADLVKRILVDKEDFPAARVRPQSGDLVWILDQQAASLLPNIA